MSQKKIAVVFEIKCPKKLFAVVVFAIKCPKKVVAVVVFKKIVAVFFHRDFEKSPLSKGLARMCDA